MNTLVRQTQKRSHWLVALLTITLFGLVGCGSGAVAVVMAPPPAGDPERGLQAIVDHGCHTCHAIPGAPGPKAWIGPPLNQWSARHYIAGTLVNTPENLSYWIRFPQEVEPGTAMPNLGVSEQEAQDISNYLYTVNEE